MKQDGSTPFLANNLQQFVSTIWQDVTRYERERAKKKKQN
jgi:hypothetical protein